MYIYIYIYTHISLSLYIYIYIYICREGAFSVRFVSVPDFSKIPRFGSARKMIFPGRGRGPTGRPACGARGAEQFSGVGWMYVSSSPFQVSLVAAYVPSFVDVVIFSFMFP